MQHGVKNKILAHVVRFGQHEIEMMVLLFVRPSEQKG